MPACGSQQAVHPTHWAACTTGVHPEFSGAQEHTLPYVPAPMSRSLAALGMGSQAAAHWRVHLWQGMLSAQPMRLISAGAQPPHMVHEAMQGPTACAAAAAAGYQAPEAQPVLATALQKGQ